MQATGRDGPYPLICPEFGILTAFEPGGTAGLVIVHRLTALLGVVLVQRPRTLPPVTVAV